jgi:hypothetical protein
VDYGFSAKTHPDDVWRRTGSIQRTVGLISEAIAASATREAAMLAALERMAAEGTSVDTAVIVQAVNEAGDATSAIVRGLLAEVDELQAQLADRDARLAAALAGGDS